MEKPVLFIQFIPIKIPTPEPEPEPVLEPEPEPKEDTTWIADVVIDFILELPLNDPDRRPSGLLIPEFWSDNRVYAEWGKDINLEQMESIVKEKLILIDSDPGWLKVYIYINKKCKQILLIFSSLNSVLI